MYFHQEGLKFFITETRTVIKDTDSGIGRDREILKVNIFRERVLLKMQSHLADILQHIENDDLLNKVNRLVRDKVLTVEKALENPEKYQRYVSIVKEIAGLHRQITPIVAWLIDFIPEGAKEGFLSGEWIGSPLQRERSQTTPEFKTKLRDLLRILEEIYEDSVFLGKTIKSLLEEIQEDLELKKRMLKQDQHSIEDFERNFRSWMHDLL